MALEGKVPGVLLVQYVVTMLPKKAFKRPFGAANFLRPRLSNWKLILMNCETNFEKLPWHIRRVWKPLRHS